MLKGGVDNGRIRMFALGEEAPVCVEKVEVSWPSDTACYQDDRRVDVYTVPR